MCLKPLKCLWFSSMFILISGIGEAQDLSFAEVSVSAGIQYETGYVEENTPAYWMLSGGVATGDYNADGFADIFVCRGSKGKDLLLRNNGDGSFSNVAQTAGINRDGFASTAPLFFDYNGDGWLDLIVACVYDGCPLKLYKNNGDGTYSESDAVNEMAFQVHPTSLSAGDFDGDQYPDLFISHWDKTPGTDHLWRNLNGTGFKNEDFLLEWNILGNDFSFGSSFSDIDGDGDADLLVVSDFGTSKVLENLDGDRYFEVTDSSEITDENGMGSAIGDYDNDGDVDWFVSSIWDRDTVTMGNWGGSGNKLYRNRGNGQFTEVAAEAGVVKGDWGWASSFADFNNDGWLDLIHVNGWREQDSQFFADSTKVFLSNGDGTFTEQAVSLGIHDTLQGRALAVLDYDRDGDLDVVIYNFNGPVQLYQNRYTGDNHWLQLDLRWKAPNLFALGARVEVFTDGSQQTREVRCGTNYLSQNPMTMHFGLGAVTAPDSVHVIWPDGVRETFTGIPGDRSVLLEPAGTAVKEEQAGRITFHALPDQDLLSVRVAPNVHYSPTRIAVGDMDGRVWYQSVFHGREHVLSVGNKPRTLWIRVSFSDGSSVVRKLIY